MILFKHKYQTIGYLCLIPAILIFIAKYIFKLELEFLYVPVFAIQSTFFETKYFFWMQSNISEELFAISLILGFTLIALSKEKDEIVENNTFRLKAFSLAVMINSIFLVFGMFFFYGLSALNIIIINLFSFLFLYILIFKILIFKARRQMKTVNSVSDGLDN
jgi:hypothetical protein